LCCVGIGRFPKQLVTALIAVLFRTTHTTYGALLCALCKEEFLKKTKKIRKTQISETFEFYKLTGV